MNRESIFIILHNIFAHTSVQTIKDSMMNVGDLVRYKGENASAAMAAEPEGSKWRKMASVYWFHLARNSPMEHAQGLLELVNENR